MRIIYFNTRAIVLVDFLLAMLLLSIFIAVVYPIQQRAWLHIAFVHQQTEVLWCLDNLAVLASHQPLKSSDINNCLPKIHEGEFIQTASATQICIHWLEPLSKQDVKTCKNVPPVA